MSTIRTITVGLLLSLASAGNSFGQSAQARKLPAPTDPTVTVSVSATGVRFAAPGTLGRMRLEVFSAAGDALYRSEFQPGTVRDWAVRDQQGLALPDGAYLCVVTLRDLSGRLSVKQGNVVVENGQAALQLSAGAQVGAVEPEQALAPIAAGNETAAALLVHNGRDAQVISTRGGLTFRVGDFFAGQDSELMRLTPAGNLGLGTQKPQAKLDVAGDIRADGWLHVKGIEFLDGTVQTTSRAGVKNGSGNIVPASAGTGTQGRHAKWTDNSGTLGDALISETGQLIQLNGAGVQLTAAPSSSVDTNLIYLNSTSGTTGVLAGSSPSFGAANGPYFALRGNTYSAIAGQRGNFVISAGNVTTPGPLEGVVKLITGSDAVRLLITPTGNVGIGTTAPQSLLDVAGNINTTGNLTATGNITGGNIAATYQDVAEWVDARQALPAGTVVTLDTTRRNGVMASTRPYDTHVAGVISAQPGVTLGHGGAGRVLVATTGRVKVKVAATRQPVRIGDLLVTSTEPGVAMRSQPIRVGGTRIHRPGTIIGKALEPLAQGTGEILVLLSLQ